ncbi:hypothetical protein CTI12_AA197420 [Artemisia annua]|uniref:Uncharacterized protein n=1 Tax=Artemisia annua TaxID=35608 RepID=A0A2U1P3R2_ARTAN|nr:hypothetical protein CTI12_AA197420 [Artemisia annua]
MENLPEPLILEILTRLNDSTESTRTRLTSRTFNSAYPHLKSINLQYPLTMYLKSRSNTPQPITPFKEIFSKMVENLLRVESVCIGVDKRMRDVSFDDDVEGEGDGDDLWLSDAPVVLDQCVGLSEVSLPHLIMTLVAYMLSKSFISNVWLVGPKGEVEWGHGGKKKARILRIMDDGRHNLVELEVKNAWLSVENLNPMPMLTSLTLEFIRLDDEDLNELNRCFPNLEVLNLIGVGGFKLPKIHLLNLKTCHWTVSNVPSSLALITPNLITLRLECIRPTSLYVEAPMLSNFRLSLDQPEAFAVKKFQNLKTLWLESLFIGSLLLKFPITDTVDNLTLDSRNWAKGAFKSSQFTLEKVFTVFPNVSTLCINSSAWSELESCSDPEGWEMTTGRKGLKTFNVYLLLVDPSLTFSSVACHNLVELEVKNAWLSVENLNPMPMLTSLTLEFIRLDDEDLNELNRCFPNLEVLNLIGVGGFKLPKIHLLNLKTCHWTVSNVPSSLALITPNLITLRLECIRPTSLYVEAPMLSNFRLSLDQPEAFAVKKFQNLKTLWLESLFIGSLLLKFPITDTVDNLTLDSRNWAKGAFKSSQFTLEKVFTVFPNVSTLCINSSAWSELESCSDPEGWEMTTGRKGLKIFNVYLLLVDPSLTFSSVACVLDQCVGLSEVSLLIYHDVVANVSKSFISKCMARWPKVKWRWGMWKEGKEDSWIMDDDVNCLIDTFAKSA